MPPPVVEMDPIVARLHEKIKQDLRLEWEAFETNKQRKKEAKAEKIAAAAAAANKRERAERDDMKRASREATKEDKRAKKIAIALRIAAAETAAENASDNSMEIKVDKIIKKFYQFYKDYETEEYNRVKAKVSDLCGPRSRICAPYQRISIRFRLPRRVIF